MKVFNNTIKTSVTVILLVTILMSMTLLIGCGTNNYNNNTNANLTKEDIETAVIEQFINDDGTYKQQLWGMANSVTQFRDELYKNIQDVASNKVKITGHKVYSIRSLENEYSFYLVEFEPMGHWIIEKNGGFSEDGFYPYSSPFKLLNLDMNECFLEAPGAKGVQMGCNYATMINNELVEISHLAESRYILKEELITDVEVVSVYDFTNKKWIKKNVGEIGF